MNCKRFSNGCNHPECDCPGLRVSTVQDHSAPKPKDYRVCDALFILAVLAAFGIVGAMDYEDELAIEAERTAYTRAVARCMDQSQSQ